MGLTDGIGLSRSHALDRAASSDVRDKGKGKIDDRGVEDASRHAIRRPRSGHVLTASGSLLARNVASPDSGAPGSRSGGASARAEEMQVRVDTRKFRGLESRLGNIKDESVRSSFQEIGEGHSQALDAASEASAGGVDEECLLDDLAQEIARCESALDDVEGSSSRNNEAVQTFHKAFKTSIDDLKSGLAQRRAESSTWTPGSSAITEKNVYAVKLASAQGAERMLKAEIADLGAKGDTVGKAILENALATVEKHIGHLQTFDGGEALSKDRMTALVGKKDDDSAKSMFEQVDFRSPDHATPEWKGGVREETMLKALLKTAFKQAGIDKGRDVKAELLDHRKAVLNERTWSTLVRDVPIAGPKGDVTLRSTLQPQSQVHDTFSDLGGGGINCHMTKAYKHCPNVAVSRAEIGGTVLFQGIRHGVMSAFGLTPDNVGKMSVGEKTKLVGDLLLQHPNGRIKPSPFGDQASAIAERMQRDPKFCKRVTNELRTAAADHRAFDVAKTALVANGAKLDKALNGEKVTITLNSLSLLTPSMAMGTKLGHPVGLERQMRTDQEQALIRLAAQHQPVTMTVMDEQGEERTIAVTIKTRSFNFGVNMLSSVLLPGTNPISGLVNGWSNCQAQNKRAMGELRTAADEWLGQAPDGAAKAGVESLLGQIEQIYDSGSYRRAGEKSPYELTSRIALLSYMIGEDSCWNCKSGKDRTGFLDSEIKDLAMRTHLNGGQVPSLENGRAGRDVDNFRAIVLGGGNHEFQALNTGAPGYKLDVNGLANQLGGKESLAQAKALSGSVES